MKYEPVMYDELFNQLEGMLDALLQRDTIFNKMGMVFKKILTSLVEAGFSREEAVLIIANQGTGVARTQ